MPGISQPNVFPDQFSGGEGMRLYRSPLMRGRPATLGSGIAEGIDNLAHALVGPSPAQTALADDRMAQAEVRKAQLAKLTAELTASKRQQEDAQNPIGTDAKAMYGETIGPLVEAFVKNGGVAPSAPETADQPGLMGGYAMDRPAGFTPGRESEFRALQTAKRIPGKTTYGDLGKGTGEFQQQDLIRDALAGVTTPKQTNDLAATQGAMKGTAPFSTNASGITTNTFQGTRDETGAIAQANVGEIKAKTANQGSQAALHGAQRSKVQSETLPQVDVSGPSGPIKALGKDVGKAATAPTSPQKGWKMFTDQGGVNYRVNENAGVVQKKSGSAWEDVNELPAGATHIGSTIGVKDNVRTSLVLGAAGNALARMGEAEQRFGGLGNLRASPYFGVHKGGVLANTGMQIGRAATLSTEQRNKDSFVAGVVDEAVPVFTGGLRSSDSFRQFLISQVPSAIGDNDESTAVKWDIFKKNISGQSNAFRNKFMTTPEFWGAGVTSKDFSATPQPSAAPKAGGGVKFLGFE